MKRLLGNWIKKPVSLVIKRHQHAHTIDVSRGKVAHVPFMYQEIPSRTYHLYIKRHQNVHAIHVTRNTVSYIFSIERHYYADTIHTSRYQLVHTIHVSREPSRTYHTYIKRTPTRAYYSCIKRQISAHTIPVPRNIVSYILFMYQETTLCTYHSCIKRHCLVNNFLMSRVIVTHIPFIYQETREIFIFMCIFRSHSRILFNDLLWSVKLTIFNYTFKPKLHFFSSASTHLFLKFPNFLRRQTTFLRRFVFHC